MKEYSRELQNMMVTHAAIPTTSKRSKFAVDLYKRMMNLREFEDGCIRLREWEAKLKEKEDEKD